MCLGQEDVVDLRAPLREGGATAPATPRSTRAMRLKPKGHDFVLDRRVNRPSVGRHMSVTGG